MINLISLKPGDFEIALKARNFGITLEASDIQNRGWFCSQIMLKLTKIISAYISFKLFCFLCWCLCVENMNLDT